MTILITNTSQLSTHSNTSKLSQQTTYSYQLIQTPYNSYNKHLTPINSFKHLTILTTKPYSYQLIQTPYNSYNKHLTPINSFKHLTILTINTLQLSTHSNTLNFSQQTPCSSQHILISYYSSIKLHVSSTQRTTLLFS